VECGLLAWDIYADVSGLEGPLEALSACGGTFIDCWAAGEGGDDLPLHK
jgi:hypothetical protein